MTWLDSGGHRLRSTAGCQGQIMWTPYHRTMWAFSMKLTANIYSPQRMTLLYSGGQRRKVKVTAGRQDDGKGCCSTSSSWWQWWPCLLCCIGTLRYRYLETSTAIMCTCLRETAASNDDTRKSSRRLRQWVDFLYLCHPTVSSKALCFLCCSVPPFVRSDIVTMMSRERLHNLVKLTGNIH